MTTSEEEKDKVEKAEKKKKRRERPPRWKRDDEVQMSLPTRTLLDIESKRRPGQYALKYDEMYTMATVKCRGPVDIY